MNIINKRISLFIVLMVLLVSVSSVVFADNTITAKNNSSSVLVNGIKVDFESYNINGNNYFKLRDLAKVLSGTEKQFEVTWNNDKKVIELVSNIPYTEAGGELVVGDGLDKTATLNTSAIYKDGEKIQLVAYTINGNNYFKLRDIAQAFDIGITWDGETNTIGVVTSIGYETPEAEETEDDEVSVVSASFISGTEILVKFNKPIPASKAGETFSGLVYLDWDGLSPWEIGLFPNLVEGETELLIDLLEDAPEFSLPGPGKYELYIGDFENIQGPVIEVTEDLLK